MQADWLPKASATLAGIGGMYGGDIIAMSSSALVSVKFARWRRPAVHGERRQRREMKLLSLGV